jgi:hypothetical protein
MTEASVSFAGNLTDDPELRHTEAGIARAMFRVAVSGCKEQAPFFTVVVWRDQAEHAGLPAHRSRAMRAWIRTRRSWLVVERLPACAPELNPVNGRWSCLKAVELANLTGPTLAEAINQAHQGVMRVRRTPHLAYSFLRHTGLSVA